MDQYSWPTAEKVYKDEPIFNYENDPRNLSSGVCHSDTINGIDEYDACVPKIDLEFSHPGSEESAGGSPIKTPNTNINSSACKYFKPKYHFTETLKPTITRNLQSGRRRFRFYNSQQDIDRSINKSSPPYAKENIFPNTKNEIKEGKRMSYVEELQQSQVQQRRHSYVEEHLQQSQVQQSRHSYVAEKQAYNIMKILVPTKRDVESYDNEKIDLKNKSSNPIDQNILSKYESNESDPHQRSFKDDISFDSIKEPPRFTSQYLSKIIVKGNLESSKEILNPCLQPLLIGTNAESKSKFPFPDNNTKYSLIYEKKKQAYFEKSLRNDKILRNYNSNAELYTKESSANNYKPTRESQITQFESKTLQHQLLPDHQQMQESAKANHCTKINDDTNLENDQTLGELGRTDINTSFNKTTESSLKQHFPLSQIFQDKVAIQGAMTPIRILEKRNIPVKYSNIKANESLIKHYAKPNISHSNHKLVLTGSTKTRNRSNQGTIYPNKMHRADIKTLESLWHEQKVKKAIEKMRDGKIKKNKNTICKPRTYT